MAQVSTASTADSRPSELRDAMTGKLLADAWITSPEVEAAFRTVPRELFSEGFPLETVYDTHEVLRLKRDADGTVLSSVSAPWMQAKMIDQAGIESGMRVLEIGSGGYNAALLAEITGASGHVVTVDIDAEVTARTVAALEAAGYRDGRIELVTADAARNVPGDSSYDAVIVTAGAWDIPPGWLSAIADGGTLVVPLRMNGITRSIGFRRSQGRWVSASAQVCGFVPMQGAAAQAGANFPLDLPSGNQALVRFEDQGPGKLAITAEALAAEPLAAWSGVTVAPMESFADLFLWCSGFLPGFCTVANDAEAPDAGLRAEGLGRYQCACAVDDSLAWLVTKKIAEDGTHECGARGVGSQAAALTKALIAEIRDWDRRGRALPGSAITYWPVGACQEPLPGKVAVYRKACGTVTVTWPESAVE